MKPQVQPNRWSCTPTAFAIVLGVDVQELISDIGHDGSEVLWPMAADPNNRRGFHIQELVEVCFSRGYGTIQIEPRPVIRSTEHMILNRTLQQNLQTEYAVEMKESAHVRMSRLMDMTVGVLCGIGKHGNRHSVAWVGNAIIDPSTGEEIPQHHFQTQYYYIVQKLNFGLDAN